ncbi:SLOG domain-containing protein [Pseudomonas fitomaticsae]|uniref:Uncharacterized protein n=1 Tax=Pseudomonas fitomaticsae TaxID=2837969 RepID=A0ABY3Q7Y9_9PSED|nr:hypothetical protein [Pseudomonas fitomaticsae]UFQ01699.1 hypothetical protein KJY40_08390 [Pseudomonas fitomaticsae]
MSSIFLSASVPTSDSEYYKGCNPVLIQSALRSFLFSVVGRKHLVFGGHPSITPLILAVCEELGVENKKAVTLFQSQYFEKSFPAESFQFDNFILTPALESVDKSLAVLRKQMFAAYDYDAAVFIGGKEGIKHEHRLFRNSFPSAKVLALKSPGGAAATIGGSMVEDDELLDYDGLFGKGLKIGKELLKDVPTPRLKRGMNLNREI